MPTLLPCRRFTARVTRTQLGSFLLESLIAVFIVAIAILGLVGLISRSMQNVDDSKFRGEAAALGASLIGQMWVSDRTTATLQANFDSSGGGAQYTEFKNMVKQRLPNAGDPTVTIVAGSTPQASDVAVTITWRPPGENGLMPDHQYQTFATVGANN